MKPTESASAYTAPGILKRIKLGLMIWVLKALVRIHLTSMKLAERSKPADKKPTYTKTYSPMPSSPARVFIPPSYKEGDPPLPLLIEIHGGGFCIGAPIVDDTDNLILSHENGFCIVSIPYRLGPTHKWPAMPEDCAAMITAVLEDESLPADRTKAAVMGYSAGGNLALTGVLCLKPEVRARIKGIAAYYPAVDFVPTIEQKAARQTLAPNGKDVLHKLGPAFNYGFVPFGTDKTDPRLSPIYANREDLPPKISLLGCEYDMLCPEALDMAEDLASLEPGEKAPLGNGRNGWTKGGVRWEMVEKVVHGFNQGPATGAKATQRRVIATKMHAGVAEWLKKEVYV